MREIKIRIDEVYVPAALRKPLDPRKLEEIAMSIAADGQRTPILVRTDKDRYVLVSGRYRLEACKALGEAAIRAELVQAPKH
jgi:ParB/RepB/Spo0J family partition protein